MLLVSNGCYSWFLVLHDKILIQWSQWQNFNSLSTKHFIHKETLFKSSSLFWRSYSTQTSDKVKFTALSQAVVYSCLSISNTFELLETAWINIWPLLFATELRLHYRHHSRDEPRSVFSYAHHALPVLWLTPEAPGPSGLHIWSLCSPWTACPVLWSVLLEHLASFTYQTLSLPLENWLICTFFLKTQQYFAIFSHERWKDIYLVSHRQNVPDLPRFWVYHLIMTLQILLTVIVFVLFSFCRLFVIYFSSDGSFHTFSQWLLCSCGSNPESLLLQAQHCFLRQNLANKKICMVLFYILFLK